MNIGIDARLLSTKFRGTHRYLSNLIEYFPKFDKNNKYYIFQYEDLPREDNFYNYITIKNSSFPRQVYEHYWLNFVLPGLISKNRIDIFFTPYIFVPFKKGKWKNVIVIHDALTKVCKEYYTLHYRKYLDILIPPSIKRSDAVVTISNSAMKDIIKFYNVPPGKIQFMYHWTDEKYKPISVSETDKQRLLKKYNLPANFVFFVSVLEERKNIRAILEVSDILNSKGIDIKFVLVGWKGFGFDKIATEMEKRSNRVIHLNTVDENDLVLLYNLSDIFFFPTYYEGFGLPLLEAMKCGIPVVTSDNSSIPEVVGDAGFIGDADDYEYFADCIKRLYEDKELYSKMKNKSFEQAKKFTPDNHVKKLVEIFNNLSK